LSGSVEVSSSSGYVYYYFQFCQFFIHIFYSSSLVYSHLRLLCLFCVLTPLSLYNVPLCL
jgi:hypothetical protein